MSNHRTKSPIKREKCGTVAGWNAHQKQDEYPCAECTEAKTVYTREWRHRTGRTTSSLYTNDEIAAIRRQAAADALLEASDAYPLETAYGGAEHAVLWLKERAANLEAVPTGAASSIPKGEQ